MSPPTPTQTFSTFSITDADNIYNGEIQLLDEFNDFNSEYANYIRCNYNNKYKNNNNIEPLLDENGDILTCSRYELRGDSVLKKYTLLRQKIIQLNNNIQKMPKKNQVITLPNGDTVNPMNVVPEIKTLQTNENTNIRLRNELDNNLYELNEYENSIALHKKKILDSTIYASLLWTTGATILVLLVFKYM